MTKEHAIEHLKQSIDLWNEFWGEASHYISDEDIEAIEYLINEVKNK